MLERLLAPPFTAGQTTPASSCRSGPGQLLDWLEGQPGQTWQDSWLATRRRRRRAPRTGGELAAGWLRETGGIAQARLEADAARPRVLR